MHAGDRKCTPGHGVKKPAYTSFFASIKRVGNVAAWLKIISRCFAPVVAVWTFDIFAAFAHRPACVVPGYITDQN